MRLEYNNPFAALKHKNYRYYWIGMCVSLIGSWMQNIAQPWLAYSITGSAFLLSLIGTLQFTPVLLFSLFAGVFIDKFSKKKIILITQTSAMTITFILAILVYTNYIKYWHILIASTVLGFVNTLDMPARQAFIKELVGKHHLMNAIALNSTVFNFARIVGPAIAGIVMGKFGIAVCFFANSISFAAVIISLIFIKPIESNKIINSDKNGNWKRIFIEIKAGIKYILDNKILLDTIIIVTILSIFAINFSVLIPVFAKEILKQNESGFGFLLSFMGIGSLIGSLFVAANSVSDSNRFIRFMFKYGPVILSVFLILIGFTKIYFLSALCLVISGFCFVSYYSIANSTLQLNSSDEYRGRVMSIYSLVFAGSSPIGNLISGTVSQYLGANIGFIFCGAVTLILVIPIMLINTKKYS